MSNTILRSCMLKINDGETFEETKLKSSSKLKSKADLIFGSVILHKMWANGSVERQNDEDCTVKSKDTWHLFPEADPILFKLNALFLSTGV